MTARNHPDRPNGEGTRKVDPFLEVRETHLGKRPGDRRVKIVRPFEDEFGRGEEGHLVASERTVLQRSGWTATLRGLRTFLIGRPISSKHEHTERLTKLKALAIFSSDNISSSAYGPEEIMRVIAFASVGALALTLPLAGLIVLMLAIVTASYRQTIRAYPNGASSYIVASDNLGDRLGVLAAAALLIGYVVTVAVSISAGVAAMTSIMPSLFPIKVELTIGFVALRPSGIRVASASRGPSPWRPPTCTWGSCCRSSSTACSASSPVTSRHTCRRQPGRRPSHPVAVLWGCS